MEVKQFEAFSRKDETFLIGHPEDILGRISEIGKVSSTVNRTFVVVDEAHCILEWGPDFRRDYSLIADVRPHIQNSLHILAITAIANKSAQQHIAFSLGIREPTFISYTFTVNKNITLSVQPRLPSTGGSYTVEDSYDYVFKPLLLNLHYNEDFQLTIVYTKLQWCGAGIQLAKRLLGDKCVHNDYIIVTYIMLRCRRSNIQNLRLAYLHDI